MMHEEGIRCAIILTNLIVSEFIYMSIECLCYEGKVEWKRMGIEYIWQVVSCIAWDIIEV